MASEVKLPRLGQGMESGTIVKWLKAEGDAVEKGEPLYELDTEKVTQEVEAEASGVLLEIAVPDGEVPVGTTIAYIGEAGEQVAAGKAEPAEPAAEDAAPSAQPAEREPAPVTSVATPPERQEGERVKASPLARRLAREQGIDLAALSGTGPDGRIVAEDVERAATAAPPAEAAPAADRPQKRHRNRRRAGAGAGTGPRRPRPGRRRARAAELHPEDDRQTSDGGLAGPRLPARPVG